MITINDQSQYNNWILDKSSYTHNYISSNDNLKLHAYSITNSNTSNIWVIIVHGYLEKAIEMAPFAKEFYNLGYNLLIPDLRAHGESEGRYVGLGWTDRLDLIDWINYIIYRVKDARIILFGLSMGASAVMMASGEKLPPNVKVVIEDCGFSSIWDELTHQIFRIFKLPAFPSIYFLSFVTRVRAGYWLGPASAKNKIKNSITPTLFIHGDADDIVPSSMIDEVYTSAKCSKEKLIIPNAGHGNSHLVNPKLYWDTILNFIEKYI